MVTILHETVVNTFYTLDNWCPEAVEEGGLSRMYTEQLPHETRLDPVCYQHT